MRRTALLLLLVAGLAGLAATADALVRSGSRGDAPSTARWRASHGGLRVSARVQGLLYPGARLPVIVRIENRWRRPLTIRRARVWVERAPLGCSPASLRFGVFRGYIPLPARGVRRLLLSADMLASAGSACQGAGFRLGARARAGPRRPR